MAKFRKRALVIDAHRVNEFGVVVTLEGQVQSSPGDWLIVGVKGERYPCRDDIFRETYEPVDDEAREMLTVSVVGTGQEEE